MPIEVTKETQDNWMAHFTSQTWKIQGPEFQDNINRNLCAKRIRKDTFIDALPRITEAVIVGAGPSLDKNMHLLKELDGKVPIICTDRALPKILPYCTPSLVTILESTVSSYDDYVRWWKDIDTSKIPLLTVPYSDDLLFDAWKGPAYFANVFLNAPLKPELMHLVDKINKLTGGGFLFGGSNVGVFSFVCAANMGRKFSEVPGFEPDCAGLLRMVVEYDKSHDAAKALAASGHDQAWLDAYNPKLSVEGWHERWQADKRYGLQHDGAVKRITLIGFDHADYMEFPKEPSGPSMPIQDINGADCFLPWTWFIGQHELRLLSRMVNGKLGTEFYNCTEGGIIYDSAYGCINQMTFQEFIDWRAKIEGGK